MDDKAIQPDYAQPVADYPRVHAMHRPDATAYVDGERSCTYAELDARSNQVANAILKSGCEAGDRIAYLGVNSGPYVETFFGANKANVVYVGLNWRLTAHELTYILNDAQISMVLADEQFVPLLEELKASVPSLQRILSTEPQTFDSWRDSYDSNDPQLHHNEDDTILQFYTSGTTGNPKGVMITNRCMSEHRRTEDGLGDWYLKTDLDEVSINAMPNFHIGGLGWLLIGIFRGAKVILMPAPDPNLFLDYVEQYRATHLFVVPVVLGAMVEEQKRNPRDISSLKTIHYGASAIAPSLLKESLEIMSVRFSQYYGMTEANGVISCLAPEHHTLEKPELLNSCGLQVPGTEIKICDDQGNETARNVSGEIYVRSEGLMKGYWNMPEATADVFAHGWYKTGDGGRMDEDGFIYMTDRIKDMVVSGGENIYPSEIEHQLVEHAAILEAAVIGVPDEKWGESLKAFIVVEKDPTPNSEEIIEFLRDRLAGYKIPRLYEIVDELPRTPSGKIQKFKLGP